MMLSLLILTSYAYTDGYNNLEFSRSGFKASDHDPHNFSYHME